MEYVRLGQHRPRGVADRLGCMSYGEPGRGNHPWTLDEETSRPFIRRAVEVGINFFDTANVYSDGSSEEIVGRALRSSTRRDEVVIATKVHGADAPRPQRCRAVAQGDHDRDRRQPAPARHRLHRPLPDPPLGPGDADRGDAGGPARRGQGRQGALHRRLVDVRVAVRQGALPAPTCTAGPASSSMQDHYNLLYREEEREMLPLCADQGIGVLPWSPLARGRLTRDWDADDRTGPRPTRSAAPSTTGRGRPDASSSAWPRSPTGAASRVPRSRWRGCRATRW